jgi:hypothetical protein
MNLYSYNRVYSLGIAGPPEYVPTVFDGALAENQAYGVLRNIEYRSFAIPNENVFTKHQVVVSVSQSAKASGAGEGTTISIYNLDESSIRRVSKKNNLVVLKAGYGEEGSGDKQPVIFVGQVQESSTKNEGSDTVTTLSCKEAATTTTSVRINLSIPPLIAATQLNYEDVFNILIRKWKENGVAISRDNIQLVSGLPFRTTPKETFLKRGITLDGYLRDSMNEICNSFNYVWYIHNNTLHIHPEGLAEFLYFTEIRAEQIKSIKSLSSDVRNTAVSKPSTGIEVKTFLNGNLILGKNVKIIDGQFKGSYLVQKVSHKLDYRGDNAWETTIECKEVG